MTDLITMNVEYSYSIGFWSAGWSAHAFRIAWRTMYTHHHIDCSVLYDRRQLLPQLRIRCSTGCPRSSLARRRTSHNCTRAHCAPERNPVRSQQSHRRRRRRLLAPADYPATLPRHCVGCRPIVVAFAHGTATTTCWHARLRHRGHRSDQWPC